MDTSGSTHNQIHKFLSEICAIHEDLKPERMVFIQCDTEVDEARIVDVTGDEELTDSILNVGGGGGTLFQPVFRWVEQQQIEPEGMVFFTDLAPADNYPPEPDYPVLWVSTDANEVAPWGQTTYLLQ
jgi:predicted metal-dependent peptidase